MAPNPARIRSEQSPGAYSFGPKGVSLRVARPRPVSGTIAKVDSERAQDGRSEPRARNRVAERRMQEQRDALSSAVTQALAARRYGDALAGILKLVSLDPCEPRWHQKYGEVLRTLGRNGEAAAAYRRAARRYDALALHARASAALRVADTLEGVCSTAVTVPTSTDRQRLESLPPPEENVTLRPPEVA